ncbi:glycosyltransferase [Tabrizicola soli]|uniref:Glycosyltransferase n=1 Tax=Tabrizicola soli TaxID=2185115 RepID=A0ABV7DQ94_9RHOB|nr:glycosyltransferase [Tabrizicola soli]
MPEAPDSSGWAALPPVVIVCLAIRHGGVDVRIVQTARKLRQEGCEFVVVVIAGTGLHRTLTDLGLPVAALPRSRLDPRLVPDLVRIIRRMGAGLIDAHNGQSQFWGALAALATGIRGRVATVHSVYREDHAARWRQRIHELALHLCKALGFRFLAVSSNVQRYLVEDFHVDPARLVLSRNGMEDLAEPPPPFDMVAETGWPADTVVLAIIGRLDPRKGHRFLLHALAAMVRAGDHRARLLVVGAGREEGAIRALVQDLQLQNHVHFTGFRSEVFSILTRVDILCLPSTSEGLPYSVIEAARQSVPTLASRLEGTDDIFVEGETILFTRIGDAEDIREKLTLLLDNPDRRREIGAAARRMFLKDLSVERMLGESLEIYTRALR